MLRIREAHADQAYPFQQESARFCVKWGSQGSFNRQKAQRFLEIVERYWDAMTGPLGYDQTRGINKEKRRDYKMNIYIAGTGLKHPGEGCYLGCDPEGVHYTSTNEDLPTTAHELGHLAEMGTYGFINHPQVGWIWESCSQWMLYYFHNDKPPGILHWLNQYHNPMDNFDCRYDSWLFFHYLQKRFGESFNGQLWSMADQDELPFAAIQRAVPQTPFPDVFADFAARCSTWDFEPLDSLSPWLKAGVGDQHGWSRFVQVCQDEQGMLRPADRPLSWFGFHVIDLRPWLSHAHLQAQVVISVQAQPHRQDWRIALVRQQADGRVWRLSEGWTGDDRAFTILPDDQAIMLVVCPAGRHDDKQEAPRYAVALRLPVEQSWACAACTFLHEGRQNKFLACALCGSPRT